MSLDIGLAIESSSILDPATQLALEDDGYYWFLYPLFETLAERTCQMIDIYGDAEFRGASLDVLRETIAEARQMVEGQPEKWDVLTGHTFGSHLAPINPPEPVYQTVDKATFLALLDRFEALNDESVQTGRRIVCIGD